MMKKLLILILYCCFALVVQAQDEQSASAKADTLQQVTDLKQTIALLRSNQNILGKSNALGNLYGSLSWNYLLSKDYKPAEQMALKALQTDSTQAWVRISLAHALMFQGKTAAAIKLYDELINTPSGYQKETYATILSDDFELLKNKGIIPAFSEKDFDGIQTEANRINQEMSVWKQFNTLQQSGRNEEAFALIRPHIDKLPKQYGIWIAKDMTESGQYYYRSERSDLLLAEKYLLEASSIYEKVLGKNHPRYASSMGDLGDLYYYLSDYSTQPRENYIRAKVYYNKYHTLGNKVQNDKAILAQAYALGKAGNYMKAISLLQNNQKHFTEPYRLIDFYNDLAWYYLFTRNAPLAEKMALKALQTSNTQSLPIAAWLQTNLAHALLFQGKTAEAGKIYNKLAGIRPEQRSDGTGTYATVLFSDFQLFEKAGIVSQKCQKDLQKIKSMIGNVNSGLKILMQFDSLWLSGKYGQAVVPILPYIDKLPFHIAMQTANKISSIGKNYTDSADYIHAENYLLNAKAIYEQILGKDPRGYNYATLLTDLSLLYRQTGKYMQADKYYLAANLVKSLNDIDQPVPGKSFNILKQANHLIETKKYTDAIAMLHHNTELFNQENNLSGFYNSLCLYYLLNGQYQPSEQMALNVIEKDSTNTDVKIILVHALLFQGKTSQAKKSYEQLAKQSDNYDEENQYSTALTAFLEQFEAEHIIPDKHQADFDSIRSTIKKINEEKKMERYAQSVLERADTLIAAKNYREAIDLLQGNANSFRQQALQVELYHKLSSCCLFTKAFELSEQTAQKAVNLDTEIKSRLELKDGTGLGIRTNLAHALLLQGKPAKAEAIYNELINREYGADIEEYAAGFLNDFKQFEAADILPENIRNDFEKVKTLIAGINAEIKVWQQFGQLCDSSRYEQALGLIRAHLNKMPKTYLLRTASRLSDIATNQPGAAQAEKYYLEAMNSYQIATGKESNEYASALDNLANLYKKEGKYTEAENYYLQTKDIYEKVSGKNSDGYATALDHLGELYKDKADYLQAEQYYQQAKNLRENLSGKQPLDYATSLNHLAQLYRTTGNYRQAEKYYLEAKNLQQDSGHYYVNALNDLDWLYQDMHDYLKAEKIALEALDICKTMRDKGEDNYGDYQASLHNLASLYLVMKDYTRAEKYYLEEKQIIASNGKDHPFYVNILNDLAAFYSASGNYPQAQRCYQEALQISEKWGQKNLNYAATLSNMGLFHQHTGDYTQAEKYLLKAKTISENALGQKDLDYAAALDNLGNLYINTGNYAQGESDLVEAKNIREKILGKEHPAYARSLTGLGVLYLYMGNYVQAEKYLQEAHIIFEKKLSKEHPDYASSLNNLGLLYYSRNNKELSEKYYLQALNIEEKLNGKDNAGYAIALGNLGWLYATTGNYSGAELYLLEAKAIHEKVQGSAHPDYAICLHKLGSLYHKKGDYMQAEKYLSGAKDIFFKKLGPNHPDYINVIKNLELLYFAMGNYVKATLLGKELIQSATRDIEKNFSFLSDQQRNQYWEKKKDIFDAGYSLCWYYPTGEMNGLNYNNTLFTKGLLLRTSNGIRDGIYTSASKELISRFEQLDNIHKQINAQQQKPDYNKEQVSLLQARADNLDKDLAYASTLFRDMKSGLSISWQQVQKQLQPSEAAVEFVHFRLYDKYKWTDTIMYAALILRPGMPAPKWVPLLGQKELDALLQPAGKDQQQQTENLYATTGKKLYDAIWKPLEQALQGVTSTYYSPSGSLYKIAFNALPTDKADVLLSDKYNLNFVSSTREILRLKNQSGSVVPKGTTAVYGGLTYDQQQQTLTDVKVSHKTDKQLPSSNLRFNAARFRRPYRQTSTAKSRSGFSQWGYLPGTRAETEQIVAWLQSKHVPYKYYTANQGSEDSFKKLSGTQTGIIHLATHGFFFPDIEHQTENTLRNLEGTKEKPVENPLLRSGLILSGANNISLSRENHLENSPEDGILTADEIARLKLTKTKLVVLSACETGLGDTRNSEGVFGLQRAFKLAGVESIIMSLWKVPDDATAELMTCFYQQWLSGQSKQSSFKAAQKKVRQKYKSAYYWAAFVMMD